MRHSKDGEFRWGWQALYWSAIIGSFYLLHTQFFSYWVAVLLAVPVGATIFLFEVIAIEVTRLTWWYRRKLKPYNDYMELEGEYNAWVDWTMSVYPGAKVDLDSGEVTIDTTGWVDGDVPVWNEDPRRIEGTNLILIPPHLEELRKGAPPEPIYP